MRFFKLDGQRHRTSKINERPESAADDTCSNETGETQGAEIYQMAVKLKQLADAMRAQIVATEDRELRQVLMAELGKVEMRRAYESQVGRRHLKNG